MTSTISNHVNQLENRIDKVENEHKAGVASAMAIGGLTQAYLPGKNMFSMAGSVYQGHTGYAIGLSSISDNGKWIVKGTVSSATKYANLVQLLDLDTSGNSVSKVINIAHKLNLLNYYHITNNL